MILCIVFHCNVIDCMCGLIAVVLLCLIAVNAVICYCAVFLFGRNSGVLLAVIGLCVVWYAASQQRICFFQN